MNRIKMLFIPVLLALSACSNRADAYLGRWQAVGNKNNKFTIMRAEPIRPHIPLPDGEPRFLLVYDNNRNRNNVPLNYFASKDALLGKDDKIQYSCQYVVEDDLLKFTVTNGKTEIYVMFRKIK